MLAIAPPFIHRYRKRYPPIKGGIPQWKETLHYIRRYRKRYPAHAEGNLQPSWVLKTIPSTLREPMSLLGIENDTRQSKAVFHNGKKLSTTFAGIENDTQHTEGTSPHNPQLLHRYRKRYPSQAGKPCISQVSKTIPSNAMGRHKNRVEKNPYPKLSTVN